MRRLKKLAIGIADLVEFVLWFAVGVFLLSIVAVFLTRCVVRLLLLC